MWETFQTTRSSVWMFDLYIKQVITLQKTTKLMQIIYLKFKKIIVFINKTILNIL